MPPARRWPLQFFWSGTYLAQTTLNRLEDERKVNKPDWPIPEYAPRADSRRAGTMGYVTRSRNRACDLLLRSVAPTGFEPALYPQLTAADVQACLGYAARAVDERELPVRLTA